MLSALKDLGKILIFALLIVIPIRLFVIQPFYVKGASMEPNFEDHQYLIIDEISIRFREIKRGEVVVFKGPETKGSYFIKRVIGLPGEGVMIKKDGVYIYNLKHPNGIKLDESLYLHKNYIYEEARYNNVVLKEDEYFVMGDNRMSSWDSRVFGPIKRKDIKGVVIFRGWPINKLEIIKPPNYNI